MAEPEQPDAWKTPGPTTVAFGFDVLDRIEEAIAMVKERLRRAVTALEARGIPYAVVGGHAVAAWVSRIDPAAVRTTVDVDLLVARGDFEAVKAALEEAGFVHSFNFGIDVGLIDATTLERLPEPLRPRLAELLANPGG